MRFLVFRGAVPFAYAAFYLGLLAISLLALWLILRAFRNGPHRLGRFVLPVVLLLGVALIVAANLREEAALDSNPVLAGPAELLGIWRDGPAFLELRPDSSYRCEVPTGTNALCGTSTENGRWWRDGDFVLVLAALEQRPVKLRIIRYADALHLTDEQEDPDMWSGHLGFHR